MTGLLDTIRDGVAAGGPVIVILGVLSVYSLTLLLGKVVQLAGVLGGRTRRAEALATVRRGDRAGARRALEDGGGGGPVDRVLVVALRALESGLDRAGATEEAERAGNAELERLRRNLRVLDVIAMISPLLGLLGTVLGMIESFRQLDMAGGAAARESATPVDSGTPSRVVLVRLTADGRMIVRGEAVPPARLGADLATRAAGDSSTRVLILPSGEAPTQALVSLLALATRAGVTDVRVVRLEVP
jgi:biopolymer transport protein ExbB